MTEISKWPCGQKGWLWRRKAKAVVALNTKSGHLENFILQEKSKQSWGPGQQMCGVNRNKREQVSFSQLGVKQDSVLYTKP